MNPKVDSVLAKEKKWQEEFKKLRQIILSCKLSEELKWGQPCYTLQDKNVVLIHGFKEYCAILFMKGALLKDPEGILIQQTENVQAARQLRFASLKEITKLAPVIKAYVLEAMEIEKAGLKVSLKETAEYSIPEEFQARLDDIPALRSAFEALTPGRQRAYLYFFSQPKQSKTREARVQKHLQRILDGKGIDDQ
jgi:uncharacterized protein YdeI (YjbR/CyaY-like superfamily)